jgi:hypothetical protein
LFEEVLRKQGTHQEEEFSRYEGSDSTRRGHTQTHPEGDEEGEPANTKEINSQVSGLEISPISCLGLGAGGEGRSALHFVLLSSMAA